MTIRRPSSSCLLTTDRSAFVGIPEDLRFALDVVGVDLFDVETGLLDVVGDVSREVAAARETFVQRFQTGLCSGDLVVGCVAVFYEVERAAGFQDASYFGERCLQVRDGAEGPGRERRVELVRGKIEMFTGQSAVLDRDGGLHDARLRDLHAHLRGFDGDDLLHLGRVVRRVERGPETDLHDRALEPFAHASAYWPGGLAGHRLVLESREKLIAVQTHGDLLVPAT